MIDLHLAVCTCSREHLAGLPDEELIALADAVAVETGEEIVRASQREAAVEGRLARDLATDFDDDFSLITREELAALKAAGNSPEDVQAAVAAVDRRMSARALAAAGGLLKRAVRSISTIAHRVVRGSLMSRGWLGADGRRSGGVHVGASLTQADAAAIEAFGGRQTFWIGEFWNRSLSARIAATVAREQLTGGLGREQAGRVLRGVVSGEFPGASVPGTWRGSSDSYFRMLSGTARAHASAHGALTSLSAAQFQRYRIEAVMDERTSERCRVMHGRSFQVAAGVSHMNATIGAEDPEELKSVAGWKTAEEIRQAAGDGDARSQERGLLAAGLALPPYHASCRTIVIPD